MPTQGKVNTVAEISKALEESAGFFVIHYRGLSVKDSQDLRRSLTESGAHMKVYKNNLVRRALADANLPEMDFLVGPSAYVFYGEDPVAPAKVLKKFAKELQFLEIRGGLADGQVVDVNQVKAIADLPSREELIAKLLGTLQNPLAKVVRVLNGPQQQFAQVVKAIADQKSAA
ncbi:MAG: 50S ribosomal protein L10 [Coriobacteriia bacterium]|nr:50S ribosomal protein L10 [Coriobacteriia bacterium]